MPLHHRTGHIHPVSVDLAVFVYPGGIKAPDAERLTVSCGRQGLLPAEWWPSINA